MPEIKPCDPPALAAFHVAVICALPTEANPMTVLLDHEYEASGSIYMKSLFDANSYTTGRIGSHNVVVVHMPGPGITDAEGVATQLKSTFKNISVCLVVGVCGGVPAPSNRANILLGDVIIATAVVQTDMGRQYPDHFSRKTGVEESLGRASREIRAFLGKLQSERVHERLRQRTDDTMAELTSNVQYFKTPCLGRDKLVVYPADYRHKHRNRPCEICDQCETQCDPVCDVALYSSCDELGCMAASQITRNRTTESSKAPSLDDEEEREETIARNIRSGLQRINIHFGRIASSNQVMKSGQHRDEIANRERVIGFEMESAGIWEVIPTIVIKAVADYADCHKSKDWQPYSAGVAAACAKAVLAEWRDTDRVSDDRRDVRSRVASPERVDQVNQEIKRQIVNGNVFYGTIHYHGHVGSFDEVIRKGAEAITRSNQSLQHSQEQREAKSSYIDSLMGAVKAAGDVLFQLLLGPMITPRINALAGNYFANLTITQDALTTQIRETDAINEDLYASSGGIKEAMVEADIKLYELYDLLFEQDHGAESLSIDDAASEVPRPVREQDMEELKAGNFEVHHADHLQTCCQSERITCQETEALADQGKNPQTSSSPVSSPGAIQIQQTERIQLLQHQIAMLEDQKCNLSAQLDLIRSEVNAQQAALEISAARIRDLQARERKAQEERERQRRRTWCWIL